VTHNVYDDAGNLTQVTDPTGAKTTATFDDDDQQLTQVAAAGNVTGATAADFTTTCGYDNNGNQT
jgi:YD repeat-containing protein